MRRPGIGLMPLLVLPALAINLVVFLWPVLHLAALSLYEGFPGGGLGQQFTTLTWTTLLTDDFNAEILVRSVLLALVVSTVTLVCGYPIALFVHHAPPAMRNLLIIVCIAPLLLSTVVRTYGWLLILGDNGFLPGLLRAFGMREVPRLVFNATGVVIGLGEIFMPYMILSLLAGFGRLDATLEDAAATLGASPFTAFRRIVLPLTLPGILLGSLLVFVLSVSSFVTPKLLGGGRVLLLATEIYDQAIVTLQWPLAAALSVVALLVFGSALAIYGRLAAMVERSGA